MDQYIQFLSGGGEMGALTRKKDWTDNVLGVPKDWPQSLRTTLGIVLNSKFPMFLWWGPELICFYNDAYRTSLGENGKHPGILGMPAQQAWTEIWHIIEPLITQVLSGGEAVWFEDQLIPIFRNGQIEDVYWTFSYSPVNDESGRPAGVLVTCCETTEKVIIRKNLEESKAQLQFAIEATELGTFDYNPATNRFTANNRLKEWFGLGPDCEIELQHAMDAIGSKDRQRVKDALQKSLQYDLGGSYDIEYTIVHPVTKKETTVHAKGRAWFTKEKVAHRFNGTLQDITQQVAARKKIEESEKRFRNVANSAPVLIWMAGPDKRCSFFNKAWLNFTGRTMEQEIDIGWAAGVFPDDLEKCLSIYTQAFDKREPFNMEYRLKRHDGVYRWISNNGVPRFTVEGIFEGYTGACMDIQDRVMSQNALKENEEKLNVVIQASELGTWELNLETKAINYSDLYLAILGYEKGTQLNHHQVLSHLHPDDRPIREDAFHQAYSSGYLQYESRIIRNDQSIHWIQAKGRVFYNENKKPVKLVGTVRDITQEKAFAAELERQVLRRTRQLAVKNLELEKKNIELQSFAYVSSHDLQEPLRKIQTFATRILEKDQHNLSEKGKDYFQRMHSASRRMQTLIEDLLAYSRTNTAERTFERTDLNKVLDQVKIDLREEILVSDAILEADQLPTLDIIPFQFRQLFQNLIGNAIKFTKSGNSPHIRITGEIADGQELKDASLIPQKMYHHITIADNGIGFDPKYKERIFEVFQRLHGKDEYKGTGIGLAIVKKIVENHNGLITAMGEPGAGATFDIYIPV